MKKELYLVEHNWNNNGDYEDAWYSTTFFGVFETFRDACVAIQQVVDNHKYMSDNEIEDDHGDILEFCEYEEEYYEDTGILAVSWWMRSGGYMQDYRNKFIIKKIAVGEFDPDIDPGF